MKIKKRCGILALILGILTAFLCGHARAQERFQREWQDVGESTFIRNFVVNGMPFTCVMVVSGGKMAGEVKTITCLEVRGVPTNTKATVYEVEAPERPRLGTVPRR